MWIISRNENELLQVDGSWERRGLHCPMVFDSHEAANEWIGEQPIESVPKDFVSIACLESVLEEKHKDDNKLFKQLRKNKKSQRWNQYIELANPIDFYKSEDANEDAWASVFERFTATHLVIVEGDVAGVLGTTSLDLSAFLHVFGGRVFRSLQQLHSATACSGHP